MPLHRRLPKRGFNNIFAKDFNEINLGRLQQAVDAGSRRQEAVTVAALMAAGLIRRAQGRRAPARQRRTQGEARLRGHRRLASAIKAVEAKGGTVTLKSITEASGPQPTRPSERRAAKRAAKAAPKGRKAKGTRPKAATKRPPPRPSPRRRNRPTAMAKAPKAKPAKKESE